MTTNLMICYPDFPFAADVSVVDPAAEAGYEEENIVTGDRGARFLSSSSDTAHEVGFFGSSITPEYVFIARADLIANAGTVRFQVQSSTDGSSWTDLLDKNPLATTDLLGNGTEDYFSTLSPGGAATYYRLYATSGSAFTFTFSKFYIGNFFDFGRDPVYEIARTSAVYTPKDRRARRIYTLTWRGISDAKRADFIDKILQYRDVNSIVLYDTNDLIFEGLTTFHCRIVNSTISTLWNNNNEIVLTFEELI